MCDEHLKHVVAFMYTYFIFFAESARISRFQKLELLSVGNIISTVPASCPRVCIYQCGRLGSCAGAQFQPDTSKCTLMASFEANEDANYQEGHFFAKRVIIIKEVNTVEPN